MRTVAVVSGHRAEYGLLRPVIKRIHADPRLNLRLLLCGFHFRLHETFRDVERDGFEYRRVQGRMFGSLSDGFVEEFTLTPPEFVLVLGDRESVFASAFASARTNTPLAHIHGGDRLDSGHIDEPIRHSISKFAHIHFAACRSSADRLEKMGEEKWRIHNVGTPAIDAYLDNVKLNRRPVARILLDYGLHPEEQFLLVMQHPSMLEYESAGTQMRSTLQAVRETGMPALVIYPNGDKGSDAMIREIEKFGRKPRIIVRKSIPHVDFFRVFESASVIVGNTSAGLIEGSYMKRPFVHPGTRNSGREHGENVIFTSHDPDEILAGIRKALRPAFRKKAASNPHVYGRGDCARRIVEKLATVKIDKKLMTKKLSY